MAFSHIVPHTGLDINCVSPQSIFKMPVGLDSTPCTDGDDS
jgi:hypothetical protein